MGKLFILVLYGAFLREKIWSDFAQSKKNGISI